MAVEIAKLFASVGIDTKNFDKGISGLKGKMSNVDSTLSGLGGGLAGIGGLLGVGFAANAVAEMGQAGAAAESLKMSFNQLSAGVGQSADTMLGDMRTASKGMVGDSDLIQSANRAMLLEVADTGEEMGKLLEIARVRGRAMGLTLSTAFDNIVTGIGRMSPLILDNLGIVVDQAAANETYAATLGKVASQLTAAEQKQALLNEVIRSSADLVNAAGNEQLTNAEKLQQASAQTQNLKEEMGLLVAGPMANMAAGGVKTVRALRMYTDANLSAVETSQLWGDEIVRLEGELEKLVDEYNRMPPVLKILTGEMMMAVDASLQHAKAKKSEADTLVFLNGALASSRSEYEEMNAVINPVVAQVEQFETKIGKTGAVLVTMSDDVEGVTAALKGFGAEMAAINTGADAIGRNIAGSAARVVKLVGGDAAQKLMGQQLATLEEQRKQMALMGVEGADLTFQMTLLTEELLGPFKQIEENARATERWAKVVPTITEEFSQVESAVSSALSGAFDLSDITGGDAFKDLLPREDAVNEDARRLADIAVKGWESPWAEYFQKERPDLYAEIFETGEDPKAKALAAMKQFEAGLRPELLDRDMLKDQIRDAILGQQAMEALIDEISTELADELGIAMTEIKGAAGGVVGGTDAGLPLPITPNLDTTAVKDQLEIETPGLGTTMAEGIEGGVKDYIAEEDLGAATSKQISDQMNAKVEDFKTPGENAGEQWGLAFLERVGGNVPEQLVNMLIDLITPGVQANLAGGASQTGAEGSPEGGEG